LKDFGRDAGNVSFADINRDVPGQGILEYLSRDDADRAVKELSGKDLRGRAVRVDLDDSRPSVDNYSRRDDDRPRDRYREDRDDRYRRDRRDYRDDRRSRSPPPRRSDYDDRRPRSPPPRRERGGGGGGGGEAAGYDSYRRGDGEDRRGSDYTYRRRDEERHSNGDYR